MSLNPKYPNLELLEYMSKVMLTSDDEFKEKLKQHRVNNKYAYTNFDAMVFSQMWGSTNTGFDIMKDGSPAFGGCAMTKEYTTVMHETLTDTYVVFFGDRPCYKVTDANERFYEDLKARNMASLSQASKIY